MQNRLRLQTRTDLDCVRFQSFTHLNTLRNVYQVERFVICIVVYIYIYLHIYIRREPQLRTRERWT